MKNHFKATPLPHTEGEKKNTRIFKVIIKPCFNNTMQVFCLHATFSASVCEGYSYLSHCHTHHSHMNRFELPARLLDNNHKYSTISTTWSTKQFRHSPPPLPTPPTPTPQTHTLADLHLVLSLSLSVLFFQMMWIKT